MIQHIISEIKKTSTIKLDNEVKRIHAIETIENLLNTIDFSSEIVPISNNEKLKHLLTQLKGSNLTMKELEIVKEIVFWNKNKTQKERNNIRPLPTNNTMIINSYFEKGTKVIFGDEINATVIEELNNGLVKVNLEGFGEMKVLKKGLEPINEVI